VSATEEIISAPEPLSYGQKVVIVHDGGVSKTVKFTGLYGNKINQPYINWPGCGEYRVDFVSGRLKLKKVASWRLCDESLKRVHATSTAELYKAKQRAKRR
jgi:hypothetical protein